MKSTKKETLLAGNRLTFRFTRAQRDAYKANPTKALTKIRALLDSLSIEEGGSNNDK